MRNASEKPATPEKKELRVHLMCSVCVSYKGRLWTLLAQKTLAALRL